MSAIGSLPYARVLLKLSGRRWRATPASESIRRKPPISRSEYAKSMIWYSGRHRHRWWQPVARRAGCEARNGIAAPPITWA